MSKNLLMDLYFKPRECPKCGKQAQPITGEFVGFDEIYKVSFFCDNCKEGFEKRFGGA